MEYSERTKDLLRSGGVVVLGTDTIYGVVGTALNEDTVMRIYDIRKRDKDKPMVILISSADDLRVFGIKPNDVEKEILDEVWPGKVSVILPFINPKFEYLSRGIGSLAFRVPDNEPLRHMLNEIGPVVAPSANTEGKEPAKTISEAEAYFGADVDFYEDAGRLLSEPSTLIAIEGGKPKVVREGAVKI